MSGPCLKHCYCTLQTRLLARIAIGYVVACGLYLLLTRNVGTPFLDSLTDDQLRIKEHSAVQRGRIFLVSSLLSAAAILIMWKGDSG